MSELQRFFEQSVTGLLKQGKQSTEDGRCMYRGKDGYKCAIGHCITDSAYSKVTACDVLEQKRFQCYNAVSKALQHSGWSDELLTDNEEFIETMQKYHDSYHPNQWYGMYRSLGIQHKLDIVFMNELIGTTVND